MFSTVRKRQDNANTLMSFSKIAVSHRKETCFGASRRCSHHSIEDETNSLKQAAQPDAV
jgi:hypothetical protein